jgi:hypothetical protein
MKSNLICHKSYLHGKKISYNYKMYYFTRAGAMKGNNSSNKGRKAPLNVLKSDPMHSAICIANMYAT